MIYTATEWSVHINLYTLQLSTLQKKKIGREAYMVDAKDLKYDDFDPTSDKYSFLEMKHWWIMRNRYTQSFKHFVKNVFFLLCQPREHKNIVQSTPSLLYSKIFTLICSL